MDAPPTQNFASDIKEKALKHLSLRLAAAVSRPACSPRPAAASSNNAAGGNMVNVDPSMSESAIASAFSGAAADSTIEMAAGTYHFTNSLNLATKNNITVKGAGAAQTILDFKAQTAGADGVVQSIPAGSDGEGHPPGLRRPDTAGDGLKVTGGNGVHVNRVGVSWPTRTTHGGYGIYPVQCKQRAGRELHRRRRQRHRHLRRPVGRHRGPQQHCSPTTSRASRSRTRSTPTSPPTTPTTTPWASWCSTSRTSRRSAGTTSASTATPVRQQQPSELR